VQIKIRPILLAEDMVNYRTVADNVLQGGETMVLEQDITLLKEALTKGLKWMKPKPRIILEKNEFKDGVYLYVSSGYFVGKPMHKRHDLVWNTLVRQLPWETVSKVTRLHLLTPKEAKFWFEEKAAG
jgi:hypothetical protein